MSLPTEAQIQTNIGLVLKTYDETRKFGNVNATNFLALWEAAIAGTYADSTPAAQSALEAFRAQLAATLAPGAAAASLAPLLLTYARIREFPFTTTAAILRALFVHMAEAGTPVTVTSRGFTYATPSVVGSATGTGEVLRLTVDSYNYAIESALVADTKTYECVLDGNSSGGTRHNETFLVTGEAFGKDALNITGTGGSQLVRAVSCYDPTQNWIKNGGFESFSGTTATPTALTNWDVTTIGNVEMATGTPGGDVYQDALPFSSTPYALRFKDGGATADNAISQSFATQQIKWNPDVPLMAQVAFKRESSCDGTLTLTVAGKSANVVLAAQSGWTILRFTVGQDAWFRRWNSINANPASVVVSVALSSNTTGTLLLDSFVLAPWTPTFDGTFLAITSGSTPWKRGDKYTAADTCSENGVIQKWMARTFNIYVPSTSGSPTWNGSVT